MALASTEERLKRVLTQQGSSNGGRAPPWQQSRPGQNDMSRQISSSLAPLSFGLIKHPDEEQYQPDWAAQGQGQGKRPPPAPGCALQ